MDLRTLKAFLAVCRCGSITQAADLVHLSQPSLSRRMQDLEDRIGAKLFDRSRRRLQLTDAGVLLQARAAEIVEIAERTLADISESGEFLTGSVRLGCVESSAIRFVMEAVRHAKARSPHVDFELYSADGDDIRSALDADRLDMGVLLEPVESAKYESVPLPAADRWGLVVKADSPEAALSEIDCARAASLPLILPRRSIVQDVVAEWFGTPVERLRVVMRHNLPTLSICFVREGLGALLCVEGSYAMRPTEGVRFVPLAPERLARHVLVRRRGRRLAKAPEIFWRHIAAEAAGEGGEGSKVHEE